MTDKTEQEKPLNSNLASQLIAYLDCPCTLFNTMTDDAPIIKAFEAACIEGEAEGYIPVLIAADDDTLLECLSRNAQDECRAAQYNHEDVSTYRQAMLAMELQQGKVTLDALINDRKGDDGESEWFNQIIGEMIEEDRNVDRFYAIWDFMSKQTIPLVLAKIPAKNPWEVFAYVPFGNWNECPNTPELMSVGKYWYEKHGAFPAVFTHDQLEFRIKKPVSKNDAMELALEQYGFCPDIVDQGVETVGVLAGMLANSVVWSFWWD